MLEDTGGYASVVEGRSQRLIIFGQQVQAIFEKGQTLSSMELNNPELKDSLQQIINTVYEGSQKTAQYLQYLARGVEWKHFNVAFFGETNAGKSTLIEALKKGTGETIGEGQKDHTRSVSSNKLGQIKLVDMPGIEGNEDIYTRGIKRAVRKAHVVFYVVGTNKEPEEKTIKRVRNYLQDQALVYSVYNLRGKPSRYSRNPQLISPADEKVIQRIEEKCCRILGDQYAGNLTLNAHLAYLASGRPDQARQITPKIKENQVDQKKAIEVFGSLDNVQQFCGINDVNEAISSLGQRTSEIILVSNSIKFLGILQTVLGRTIGAKKDFDDTLKIHHTAMKQAKNDARRVSTKYEWLIKNLVESQTKAMENDLLEEAYRLIDDESSEEEVKTRIDEINFEIVDNIYKQSQDLLGQMQTEIDELLHPLQQRLQVSSKLRGKQMSINMGRIMEQLKISFNYIARQIADIGLSIAAVIGACIVNPILGIATGIVALFRKGYEWFVGEPRNRKREARQEAMIAVRNGIAEHKGQIWNDLRSQLQLIIQDMEIRIRQIDVYVKDLWEASDKISKHIQQLNNVKNDVSLWLSQELVGADVEMAYIDLQLNRMLIIGSTERTDLNQLFRVEVSVFSALDNYLRQAVNFRANGVIEVPGNDEFTYRFLSAIRTHLPQYRIRRERK